MTELRYIHVSEAPAYIAAGWEVTPLPPHAPFCLAASPRRVSFRKRVRRHLSAFSALLMPRRANIRRLTLNKMEG